LYFSLEEVSLESNAVRACKMLQCNIKQKLTHKWGNYCLKFFLLSDSCIFHEKVTKSFFDSLRINLPTDWAGKTAIDWKTKIALQVLIF